MLNGISIGLSWMDFDKCSCGRQISYYIIIDR